MEGKHNWPIWRRHASKFQQLIIENHTNFGTRIRNGATVAESTLLQVIAQSSYKTVSVAHVARCPRLRLSRARGVNCRQAGKLIAWLPLGPVYNHTRANRTIRLPLGTTWHGWPAVAPTDTSSCCRIDPCNRRNVLHWFTATECQTETALLTYLQRPKDTPGANFYRRQISFKRLSQSNCNYLPCFYWFLDICGWLFVIFEISKNVSRYICDDNRVLSNKYWNFMINTHFMYLTCAVFGCGFATKMCTYLRFSCRFRLPKERNKWVLSAHFHITNGPSASRLFCLRISYWWRFQSEEWW